MATGEDRGSYRDALMDLVVLLARLEGSSGGYLVDGGGGAGVEVQGREQKEKVEWAMEKEVLGIDEKLLVEEDEELERWLADHSSETPPKEQEEGEGSRFVDAYLTDMEVVRKAARAGREGREGREGRDGKVRSSDEEEELIPMTRLELGPAATTEVGEELGTSLAAGSGGVLGYMVAGDGAPVAVYPGCLVGRGGECAVKLAGGEVSRRHARLGARGGAACIQVLGC